MIITISLILFWLSVGLMFHSYVAYPRLLKLFSYGKKENAVIYTANDVELPKVFVVFSVLNEEKVIREKLESVFDTSYPFDKLKVYIGSDNSTDGTNAIIDEFAVKYPELTFVKYSKRRGKPNVLNDLVNMIEATGIDKRTDLFVFTDANVMFDRNVIYQMVKHFKNAEIAQVAANILNKGVKKDGISHQEKEYIQRENNIKYLEGLDWGCMMGALGACYTMRADCWKPIPANFIVDDFYLSMHVLQKGKKAINELSAICYEDVTNEIKQEFARKARIQAGNFQNLGVYWPLLFRFNVVSFAFLSHKVIRWLGPLCIAMAYVPNVFLLNQGRFYVFTFVLQNILLLTPFIDAALKKTGVHLVRLRFVSYFYMMNLALVKGFVTYMGGIKTNMWDRTERNV